MLIAGYVPSTEGGAERQCRRLASELVKLGHRIRVVTMRRTIAAPRNEVMQGVEIVRLGVLGPFFAEMLRWKDRLRALRVARAGGTPPSGPASRPTAKYWHPTVLLLRLERLLFLVAAAAYLARNRRDIRLIHCHESHWLAGFAGWIGPRLGCPVLVKEANYPVLLPLGADSPWRWCLQRARFQAHYVAQTTAAAEALERAGVSADSITVVANGLDLPAETADVAVNRSVLFVGHLFNPFKKALDILFAAWVRVACEDPRARLIVVGGGDQEPWRTFLEEHHAAGSVEFVGEVSDPAPYYRRAAFLVLPSRLEGLSNTLLEAQSWGVPAVVSNIPGNVALIQHGVNGLAVKVEDPEALANAIREMLVDPARRSSLGRQARSRAAAQPAFAAFAGQTVDLYERICNKSQTR
jgi:glycosyltransferase involved in cell wall biosynthesis